VGPPVAVDIDVCEYLRFFNVTFIQVQHANDLSGKERIFSSYASVDISTHSELQSKR
jgi:hypothetical protein